MVWGLLNVYIAWVAVAAVLSFLSGMFQWKLMRPEETLFWPIAAIAFAFMSVKYVVELVGEFAERMRNP